MAPGAVFKYPFLSYFSNNGFYSEILIFKNTQLEKV